MKPYIMNYSETINLIPAALPLASDTTRITETIEQVDDELSLNYASSTDATYSTSMTFTTEPADEDDINFAYSCSTLVTKAMESIDEDEIVFSSTLVTRTTEPSDDEEIVSKSTLQTNTVENSDDDDIMLS